MHGTNHRTNETEL